MPVFKTKWLQRVFSQDNMNVESVAGGFTTAAAF